MKLSHLLVTAWAVCLAPVVIAAETAVPSSTSTTTVSPDGHTTVIKVIRHGLPDGAATIDDAQAASQHCNGAQISESNSEEKSVDGKIIRTRMVLCDKGKADPAQQLLGLQHARNEIAKDQAISAEARAKVLASLDARIAALQNQAKTGQ